MTAHWIRPIVAVALLASIVGCASSHSTESTGEYVDSASITSKVKVAVLAEPGLKTLQIGVETYKDIVQLSGFVDTAANKARAGDVAAKVPGVTSVRNDLIVK